MLPKSFVGVLSSCILGVVGLMSTPLYAQNEIDLSRLVEAKEEPKNLQESNKNEWLSLHTFDWGGTVYLHEPSLKVDKNAITALLLYNLKTYRVVMVEDEIKNYASLVKKQKFLCNAEKMTTLKEIHFESYMGRGNIIKDNSKYQQEPRHSMREEAPWIYDMICQSYVDLNVLVNLDQNENPIIKKKSRRHHPQ